MSQDALRAGVDGSVACLGAFKGDFDPVLTAIGVVNEGSFFGRQVSSPRKGRVPEIRLVSTLCGWGVARVVFKDEAGEVFVVRDGCVLLVRVAVASQNKLDWCGLESALRRRVVGFAL